MSDCDPLAEAKRLLKDLEDEIVERLEATEGLAERPVMNSAVGRLTYMDAYQQQMMTDYARGQLQSRLSAVRAAQQRVEEGTYGRCVECGVAIPPERLEYMPEVPFCLKCKDRLGR